VKVWASPNQDREWISRGIELYAKATFTPAFDAWRFYNDGGEATSAPWAAVSTNINVKCGAGDRKVHLRVRIQETAGAAGASTDDYQLQVSKNAGAYANVAAASSNIKADTGSSLTDGSATTNRATNGLTDGSGAFVAGVQEEGDGQVANHALTASNFTEHVWALTLVAADLANGDTLDFRITLNGGAPGMTNSVTPRITVSKGTAATLEFQSGFYTGNGGASKAISGLGFAPRYMYIKEDSADDLYVRVDTMDADSARHLSGSINTGVILSLDSDGFTVGLTLNTNNVIYHWAAFGGEIDEIDTFVYTGNAVDGFFHDVGFTPDWVHVWGTSGSSIWKTSDLAGDAALLPDSAALTDRLQSLEAGGFTVGVNGDTNGSGPTYYGVALKDRANVLKTHTYDGTGGDDRTLTGAGFQPNFAFVKGNNNFSAHFRFKDQVGDLSYPWTDTAFNNRIQAFTSDGMQLGTDAAVNENTVAFYVLWAKAPAGTTHLAEASLAASGAIAAAAVAQYAAAAALAVSGAVAPLGRLTLSGVVALEGSGLLAGDAALVRAGEAALAVSAALSPDARMTYAAALALAAAGVLSPDAVAQYAAAAGLSAQALVDPSGRLTLGGAAVLDGSGSLAAAASIARLAEALLAASATLSPDGRMTYAGASALNAAGVLSPEARMQYAAAALLDALATVGAAGRLTLGGESQLAGSGNLAAQAVIALLAGAALTGSGALSGAPKLTLAGVSQLAASGALDIAASVAYAVASALAATAGLTPAGGLILGGAAALDGSGLLSATPTLILAGASLLEALASLTAEGIIVGGGLVLAEAVLAAAAALNAAGALTLGGQAAFSAAAMLAAEATAFRLAEALLAGSAAVAAAARMTLSATAGVLEFPTTPVLDNFNGADLNPINNTGIWGDHLPGDNNIRRIVNQCGSSSGFGSGLTNASYDRPVEVYLTISDLADSQINLYWLTDSDALTGYFLNVVGGFLQLYKLVNGFSQALGSAIAQAISAGDSLGIAHDSSGTIHIFYKVGAGAWAEIGTRSDSTYSSGILGVSVASTSVRVDDFGGGVGVPVSLRGTASLVAVARLQLAAAASLAAAAGLSATPGVTHSGAILLPSSASLQALGGLFTLGEASLSSAGSLSATGSLLVTVAALLEASAALAAAGRMTYSGAAALMASAALAATGGGLLSASISLVGSAIIVAAGNLPRRLADAIARLTGQLPPGTALVAKLPGGGIAVAFQLPGASGRAAGPPGAGLARDSTPLADGAGRVRIDE